MDEKRRGWLTGGMSVGEYLMLLLIKDAPGAAPDCWSFTYWTYFDHTRLQWDEVTGRSGLPWAPQPRGGFIERKGTYKTWRHKTTNSQILTVYSGIFMYTLNIACSVDKGALTASGLLTLHRRSHFTLNSVQLCKHITIWMWKWKWKFWQFLNTAASSCSNYILEIFHKKLKMSMCWSCS